MCAYVWEELLHTLQIPLPQSKLNRKEWLPISGPSRLFSNGILPGAYQDSSWCRPSVSCLQHFRRLIAKEMAAWHVTIVTLTLPAIAALFRGHSPLRLDLFITHLHVPLLCLEEGRCLKGGPTSKRRSEDVNLHQVTTWSRWWNSHAWPHPWGLALPMWRNFLRTGLGKRGNRVGTGNVLGIEGMPRADRHLAFLLQGVIEGLFCWRSWEIFGDLCLMQDGRIHYWKTRAYFVKVKSSSQGTTADSECSMEIIEGFWSQFWRSWDFKGKNWWLPFLPQELDVDQVGYLSLAQFEVMASPGSAFRLSNAQAELDRAGVGGLVFVVIFWKTYLTWLDMMQSTHIDSR